jgi:hypothetical protein
MQVVIVKEHFFSIGIAVLLLMTLYYGVNAVVPPPDENVYFPEGVPRYISKSSPDYTPELEQRVDRAQEAYQAAQARHRGITCSIYIPVGFLTLLLGSFRVRLELLRAAFIFGGLFMMITAIASGWQSYSVRFIASAVTLIAVIMVVRRQFSNGLVKSAGETSVPGAV